MYKFLTKNGQVLAFGLGILVTIVFLMGVLPNTELIDTENPQNVNIFNFGITATIVLIIVAAVAMVLFGLVQVASSFRTSWKGILGFAALVVLFLLTYASANNNLSNEVMAIQNAAADAGVTDANLQFIGGSITTLIVLLLVAVGTFVVFEIINFFK
jgi:putative copper export protein